MQASGEEEKQERDALEELRRQLKAESTDSLKLIEDLTDNPVCSVTFDASTPCVSVVWKRYATSTQLRYVHENIIRLLAKHGVSKVLGDDTALPTVHAEDQSWIVGDWMARAMAAGLRTAASKRPTAYFGQLSLDAIRAAAPKGLKLNAFDDLEEARRWLRETPA